MKSTAFEVKKLDPRTTALLIIDMQNDFVHEDGYLAKIAGVGSNVPKTPIPNIKQLAEAAQQSGMPVVYVQTVYEPDYADFGMPANRWRPKLGQPTFVVRGTWGAEIVDELKPVKGDYVVHGKSFDKFLYSPLELILRNRGVKTIIFTGGATNICVETTLRSAIGRGFEAILASDATATQPEKEHNAAIKRIAFFFGAVVSSKDILSLLQQEQ